MSPQDALLKIEQAGCRVILDGRNPVLIPGDGDEPPTEAVAVLRRCRDEVVALLEARDHTWIPRITVLSDVQPERMQWLWTGRVAFGKLTVFDGDPGDGKSTITIDIAARATTDAAMPDDTRGDADGPINVLLMSAEDGLADTIRPRLDAAGGDPTRIAALECKMQGEGEASVSLSDLPLIRSALVSTEARLLIIDPVMAYLPSAANSYRDQDMRGVLAPLARLAEELGVAVIIVRHFSKGGGANAVYRGGGSIGIIGQARVGMMVGRDQEDATGQRRILAVTKSNLAAFPPALAYYLEEADNGAARVVWGGITEHTASMLLAAPMDEEERGAKAEAIDYLRDLLEDGPQPATKMKAQARAAGISDATLRRARTALKITPQKSSYDGGWTWELPAPDQTIADAKMLTESPRCSPKNHEHLGDHMSTLGVGVHHGALTRNPFGQALGGRSPVRAATLDDERDEGFIR